MAFPSNPSDQQTYMANGTTFIYSAGLGVWDVLGSSTSVNGVTSVAGRSGVITLTPSDIGAGAFPSIVSFTSNIVAASGTASTTTSTGALVVVGGLGVSGTITAGGLSVSAINSTPIGSGTASTGSFTNTTITSLGVGTAASGTGGEIRATGAITAGYSDERLKTKVRRIDDALGKARRLSGVYFINNELAKSYGFTDESQQVGYLAGQMNGEMPEVVKPAPFDITKDENGNEYSISGQNFLTVQYEKVGPLLLEAIKDLADELDIIKKHIGL